MNISSLLLVPLWGADQGGGGEIDYSIPPDQLLWRRRLTTASRGAAVRDHFVPMLSEFVRLCGSASRMQADSDVTLGGELFVRMHAYFQRYDWAATWNHPLSVRAWRQAWSKVMREEWAELLPYEKPHEADLDQAYGLYMHFLMCMTSPLDEGATVVHASHHGIQAVLGAVARLRNGAAYVIWDHGILWRERVKSLAEFTVFSLFVRNSMIGLTRMCVAVNMQYVNSLVSCTNVFNADWEAHIAGRNSQARASILRRMAPVVNGMETDRFFIRREAEAPEPTGIMLSHVYDLKNVKLAIQATGVLVKTFKLTKFRLQVYGSLNKDIAYCTLRSSEHAQTPTNTRPKWMMTKCVPLRVFCT